MSTRRPRVALLGLGPTTFSALSGLAKGCDVVALIRTGSDAVCARAAELGIATVPEATLPAIRAVVDEYAPDCVVVSSYDRILPADLVTARPFINVHYAPLPRLRGRATVNWALLNGEERAWISIHWLAPGLDAGGILYQESVRIGSRDTVADLYAELNDLQEHHLVEAVQKAVAGDPGRPQAESAATYACTRIPEDGEIDWTQPTDLIDRQVRALVDPFPGAFTWLGLNQLWIDAAEPAKDAPLWEGRIPGRVVGVSRSAGSVDVLTGDGVLRLYRVRSDAGEPIPAAIAIRSVRTTLGLRTSDLVAALRSRWI